APRGADFERQRGGDVTATLPARRQAVLPARRAAHRARRHALPRYARSALRAGAVTSIRSQARSQSPGTPRRALVHFALAGVVTVVLIAVAGAFISRTVAEGQA